MPDGKVKVPKILIWQILTLIFAVLSLGLIFGKITVLNTGITSEQAGSKVVDYINKNLIQSGTCSLVSVQESGGLYKVVTTYQGQQIPVYVTKDGQYLFVSSPIDMTNSTGSTATQTQTSISKSAKPSVELYVMSFCPYGVQAEQLMKPVFDLLGTKADFKIRFIATVGGNTVDSVQSLHGADEAKEDLRQECMMKYYDSATYWKYLQTFDSNCPSLRDNPGLDTCWKDAATKAGIDTLKIQTCASGSEGLDLLKADEKLTNQYGITGSPTILINGVQYGGSRSSSAFQQGICSGFSTPPSECSQNVTSSSSGTAPSGGCG